jgi:hypothetical protein
MRHGLVGRGSVRTGRRASLRAAGEPLYPARFAESEQIENDNDDDDD